MLLNDVEVGRLKDPDDVQNGKERFRVAIPMAKFVDILKGEKLARLAIAVDVSGNPGFADDLVLRRIETEETVQLGA